MVHLDLVCCNAVGRRAPGLLHSRLPGTTPGPYEVVARLAKAAWERCMAQYDQDIQV